MSTGQFGDVLKIETFDGNELFLTDPDVKFLAYGNLGAPPTEYLTQRGYKQDGATEIDFLLQPRVITARLWHSPTCDRQTFWDTRLALHDFLRPNRNGPMTFTIRTPDGSLRSIIVRADPGLVFPPEEGDNSWNVDENLDFIAFNPLFFDADATVLVMESATQTQLVFPITFPISFGTSDEQFTTGEITYTGTWKEYPTITLTGPYDAATITNVTTGVSMFMSVAIAAGEQRIITLTPGEQSIVDENGDNKFSDLGPGSNLVEFNLRPDPEVADGIQEIVITLTGGTSDSAAELSYRNRYFAL